MSKTKQDQKIKNKNSKQRASENSAKQSSKSTKSRASKSQLSSAIEGVLSDLKLTPKRALVTIAATAAIAVVASSAISASIASSSTASKYEAAVSQLKSQAAKQAKAASAVKVYTYADDAASIKDAQIEALSKILSTAQIEARGGTSSRQISATQASFESLSATAMTSAYRTQMDAVVSSLVSRQYNDERSVQSMMKSLTSYVTQEYAASALFDSLSGRTASKDLSKTLSKLANPTYAYVGSTYAKDSASNVDAVEHSFIAIAPVVTTSDTLRYNVLYRVTVDARERLVSNAAYVGYVAFDDVTAIHGAESLGGDSSEQTDESESTDASSDQNSSSSSDLSQDETVQDE